MKLHRVLLFTSIQMDIRPVGQDLHVLLTSDNISHIGSTVYAKVCTQAKASPALGDSAPVESTDGHDLEKDDLLSDLGDLFPAFADGPSPVLSDSVPQEEEAAFRIESISIDHVDQADCLFCKYVAESLAKKTGQNVLCTGGIFVDNPSERDIRKIVENVDEMIKDWSVFYTDD